MNFSFAKIHVYLRQMKIFKLLNYNEILKKSIANGGKNTSK